MRIPEPSLISRELSRFVRSIGMAQELSDKARVSFRLSLDVRKRIISALTLAFFGNAVAVVCAIASAKELREESLVAIAAQICRDVQN